MRIARCPSQSQKNKWLFNPPVSIQFWQMLLPFELFLSFFVGYYCILFRFDSVIKRHIWLMARYAPLRRHLSGLFLPVRFCHSIENDVWVMCIISRAASEYTEWSRDQNAFHLMLLPSEWLSIWQSIDVLEMARTEYFISCDQKHPPKVLVTCCVG